jgi:hypothetical protein
MARKLFGHISKYASAAVLALAVQVVGHDLTFLIRYGSRYGSEIARTGDGSSWNDTARFVIVSAALLATFAGLRLAFLLRQVRTTYRGRRVGLSGSAFARIVLPVWLRLFSASIPLFVLQENYERWSVALPLPGMSVLGVVGPGSPILVFALVSLAFALVVALFRLGIDRLETMIAQARTRSWCGAASRLPTGGTDPSPVPSSVIGRNLAGRAPPALLPA